VGWASFVGGLRYLRVERIPIRVAVLFALPSLVAVFSIRRWVMPAVPAQLYLSPTVVIPKDTAILVFFSLIMLLSALRMLASRTGHIDVAPIRPYSSLLIILVGLVEGCITGIVGAGGGFLIVPALFLLARIPMKQAIGTSLLIIAFKSILGFTGDVLRPDLAIDWPFLVAFTLFALLGVYLGTRLSHRISGKRLKVWFAWFILCMACVMILRELL